MITEVAVRVSLIAAALPPAAKARAAVICSGSELREGGASAQHGSTWQPRDGAALSEHQSPHAQRTIIVA